MGLLDYIFGLLILLAIIFLPVFFKQYSHAEKNEELPSSFVDAPQNASHTDLNNNRPLRNKNVPWLEEAGAIKVAANLHITYVCEHGIVIKTEIRVSAYHTKSGLIYGYCDYYKTESTFYTSKIGMAIDIEKNEDVTDCLRSFLRKKRVREAGTINK